MGKIRVKTLGDETLEKEQKKEAKKRADAKRVAKTEEQPVEVSPVESVNKVSDKPKTGKPTSDNRKQKTDNRKAHSKKYLSAKMLVDNNKIYTVPDALTLLPKLKLSKFDETVELHINTIETGISGILNLPHGSGKQIKVSVADDQTVDTVIKAIESGKIDFDILIATPSVMPKLAKVARVLGPRGLMPNPKNGTISQKPEDAAKKFQSGQIRFKTEAKTPVIHLIVGKLSFGDKKLQDNIQEAINTISPSKIKKVVLKSTMSPAVKIDFASISA